MSTSMSTITPETTLADLVVARPELASRLDELGLDYCCGGSRTLAAATDTAGFDLATTIADLATVPAVAPTTPRWTDLAELVDWIEATHHAYLREVLPALTILADKVARAHAARHPELGEVALLVHEIRADLEPHLAKEEQVLFPMVRKLVLATSAPNFHCGGLINPIRVMLTEHDSVGELLTRLREHSSGYLVPDDGCGSYRALYAGLAEFEADTHRHVHMENNVLFPEVLATERGLLADGPLERPGVDEGGDPPCWSHRADRL